MKYFVEFVSTLLAAESRLFFSVNTASSYLGMSSMDPAAPYLLSGDADRDAEYDAIHQQFEKGVI